MNFIYKIRHKKSGLYLKLDNILDDIGSVYTSYPQNIKLNITVHLSYKYEPDSFETKTDDWLIEEFACILHDSHVPVEPMSITSYDSTDAAVYYPSYAAGWMINIPQIKINTPVIITTV